MKKGKSPVAGNDLTTPQKKLKQARLPFKLLSDVSPKPDTPPSRKRKLSTPLDEVAPKIGKVSIENDPKDELVLISDDDSKDVENFTKAEEKSVNPLAKLVDTAWKKKLQKTKAGKKKKSSKIKHKTVNSENTKEADKIEAKQTDTDRIEDVEMLDLSEGPEDETIASEAEVTTYEEKEATTEEKTITTEAEEVKKPVRKTRSSKTQNKTTSTPKTTEKNNNKKAKPIPQKKSNDSSNVNVSIVIDDDSVDPEDVTKNKQTEKQDETSQTLEKGTPSTAIKKGKTFNTPKMSPENKGDSKIGSSPKKSPEKESNKQSKESNIQSTESNSQSTESNIQSKESMDSAQKSTESTEVTEKSKAPEPITTPKRTRGSLAKDTSKSSLNDSSSSNLNSSQSNVMVTPKQVKKTDSQDKSGAEGGTPLTPKQLQRKLDSAKKRDEREKEKQEREKKRLQEKEERDKVKKEKEDAKRREREEKEEAKKKEREEKEEAKKKEKEEKERQKEMEKKLREEKEELKKREREEKEEQKKKEREEKEEQRKREKEAKEEEKRKQETEKQEQELKKKKAAEAFANFFVPKQKIDKEISVGQVGNTDILSSFTIKTDMRLAPAVRSDFNDIRKGVLDRSIETQDVGCDDLYVNRLKSGKAKPESSEKTWPLSERDDDVMIVEDELPPIDGDGSVITCESVAREKMRPKLFRFHENRRPPYWGTWRKKSDFVTPRRPFGQDEKLLDYSIDSDDEWEEEAEGESLDGSVAGSDTEAQDDEYELDNDVFVPHGYLSDEEATMDEEDVLKLSPEAQKARLKNLEDEFATELKKPTEKLKPRLYGLIWETSEGQKPEKCVDALWNYFGRFAMMIGDIEPLLKPAPVVEETEKKKVKKKKVVQEGETPSPNSEKKRKKPEKEPKVKTPKAEKKPKTPDTKKNQLGINTFLKKMKT